MGPYAVVQSVMLRPTMVNTLPLLTHALTIRRAHSLRLPINHNEDDCISSNLVSTTLGCRPDYLPSSPGLHVS